MFILVAVIAGHSVSMPAETQRCLSEVSRRLVETLDLCFRFCTNNSRCFLNLFLPDHGAVAVLPGPPSGLHLHLLGAAGESLSTSRRPHEAYDREASRASFRSPREHIDHITEYVLISDKRNYDAWENGDFFAVIMF